MKKEEGKVSGQTKGFVGETKEATVGAASENKRCASKNEGVCECVSAGSPSSLRLMGTELPTSATGRASSGRQPRVYGEAG